MPRKSPVQARIAAIYGGKLPPATYGSAHKTARAEALKRLREGEPCHFCGLPMYKSQRLQLDHAIPVVLGGAEGPKRLVHGRCNERAGAILGNKMRGARRASRRATAHGISKASRSW